MFVECGRGFHRIRGHPSPFFRRAHGGFSTAQLRFCDELDLGRGRRRILDPMSGQGHVLGNLAWLGYDVTLCDINPAVLALGFLRAPQLASTLHEVTGFAKSCIRAIRTRRRVPPRAQVVDGWFSREIGLDLARLAGVLQLRTQDSVGGHRGLWNDERASVVVGLAVLAARRFVSFGTTDNVTWLRPGGLVQGVSLAQAMEEALAAWTEFVQGTARAVNVRAGVLSIRCSSALELAADLQESADLVLTSPPYANRLDYGRMWAPELAVLGALSGFDADTISAMQIGTNQVQSRRALAPRERLSRRTERTLRAIGNDPIPYARKYYEPYFRNYALELVRALVSAAGALREAGRIAVFVRDTVRKDHLFETGALVEWTLRRRCGLRQVRLSSVVVRSHVGVRQRRLLSSVHGLAQREHHVCFERG